MALGPEAFAAADNSVALGALSDATRTNVVSVGSVDRGLTRQITNVAAGTAANDAVNKAQLDELAGQVGATNHYFAASGAQDGSDDATGTGEGTLADRSEEHTSERQSLMRNPTAVYSL